MSASGNTSPFATRTILLLVGLAVVGFLSYIVLTAYADDLRPAKTGGTHAMSISAIGFAGIADLAKRRRGMEMIRSDADLGGDALLVLTPGPDTDPKAVKAIIDRREDLPTLVILPKWHVTPLPDKPAWVRSIGKIPPILAAVPASDITRIELEDGPHTPFRTISGPKLDPAFDESEGATVVAFVGDGDVMIASDPDLFNNQGLATLAGAERAMRVLDQVSDGPIAFDLTLHGYGRKPNLLKLAFEVPFLPLTLCILLAALLAGWHAVMRFGPVTSPERGLAFGKSALADNGAALLRLARRRHRTGGRYTALVRDSVAASTGAPAGLTGAALDAYLDKLNRDGEQFSALAERADQAPDTRSLLAAARSLYFWKRTVTREN